METLEIYDEVIDYTEQLDDIQIELEIMNEHLAQISESVHRVDVHGESYLPHMLEVDTMLLAVFVVATVYKILSGFINHVFDVNNKRF